MLQSMGSQRAGQTERLTELNNTTVGTIFIPTLQGCSEMFIANK